MTASERERYSRQIRFEPIGEAGQEKLRAACVAIVGCGALGSFQAEALTRAGVGRLILVDRDFVELSNLQRQWLYSEQDAIDAIPKAIAAKQRLVQIDPAIEVQAHVTDLTAENITELLDEADLIMDGTDNFETRYLINDFAVQDGRPWIYGAAVGSYGLAMPVVPGDSACLACIYPEPPSGAQPTCETAGVLNSVTSLVAAWQVSLATRWIVAVDVPRLITTFEAWEGRSRQIAQPERDPECRACGRGDLRYLDDKLRAPVSLCGRNAVQIHERKRPLDLIDLRIRLAPLGVVRANEFALRFFPEPYEMTVFPDGRAIIKGTTDTGLARSLYARFIGA